MLIKLRYSDGICKNIPYSEIIFARDICTVSSGIICHTCLRENKYDLSFQNPFTIAYNI